MKSIIGLILMFFPQVDAGLVNAWRAAVVDWQPCRPLVTAVRWDTEIDCNDRTGGGLFDYGERIVWICWPPEHDVNVIMAHEYGHALGLEHVSRSRRISIMNDGWMEPFADHPTTEDVEAAWLFQNKRQAR